MRVKDEEEGVKQFQDDPEIQRGREAQLADARRAWGGKNAEVQRLLSEEASLTQRYRNRARPVD